jgi:hypothetical protein
MSQCLKTTNFQFAKHLNEIPEFWVGICMGGTLKTRSFVISSTKLSLNTKSLNKSAISLFYDEIR